jgi:hypothetical protein
MVVGTNAFVAYSLLCNARFPTRWAQANGFDPLNPGRCLAPRPDCAQNHQARQIG